MRNRAPISIIVIVGIIAAIWLIPMIGLVVTSIRPAEDISLGWWRTETVRFTFDYWINVWNKYPIGRSMGITLFVSLTATVTTMLLTPAAAYAFQFLRFKGRRFLLVVIINAYVLPQQVILLPLMLLWRDLGIINTVWSVIIPYVGLSFAWSIYLIKSFLEEFPKELIEASRMDGAGPFSTFWRVVLPNSMPPVLSTGILQFLWTWNALMIPLLFLRSNATLPVLLTEISGPYELNWNDRSVAAIITTAVPLIVFIVFQKYFSLGAESRSGSKD